MAVARCLGLLLLLCLSAAHAAPDSIPYDDDDQQGMPQYASQAALSLSSDSWEDNLTEFEKDLAFEEDEEVDEGMESENMQVTSEINDSAFIEALITHMNYLNKLDKPVKKDCNKGEGIYKIQSEFRGYYNDRRWNFECRKIAKNNAQVTCTQTKSYVNDFNGPIVFSCGDNQYMAGVESYHDNSKEDRRWKFTCCSASNYKTSNCQLSEDANKLGQVMDFQAGDGEVITGVNSPTYSTKTRDRIWKYKVCKYKSSSSQFAPPLGLDDIYIKTFTLTLDARGNLKLKTQNGMTAVIPLQSGYRSLTSSNNILAYRPYYSDLHRSGLAGIFVNIEKIFPCIANTDYVPICSIFTSEEDGFRKGKQYIELGDLGNNVKVFGKNIATYGLAISGCHQLGVWGCFPRWVTSTVVCLLPRSSCQTK